MKRTRAALVLIQALIGMTIVSVVTTFAWFTRNLYTSTESLTGYILDGYFDYIDNPPSGVEHGTQTNPFVITTPRHYKNLVKLYTEEIYDSSGNLYDFSSKVYYFQVGKQYKSGDNTYYVLNYDDYGKKITTSGNEYSTELNLNSLDDLEPIGNDEHPFTSFFNGHGITIKNFTIIPTANVNNESFNDIGIFGFVSNTTEGAITNAYWSNYTINTTGGAVLSHSTESTAKQHSDVRIGYLAGHVKNASAFKDCYMNKCRIQSPQLSSAQISEVGYYGLVENSDLGHAAEGKNYTYTFNSAGWFDYFNTKYSAINEKSTCLRNNHFNDGVEGNTSVEFNTLVDKNNVIGDALVGYDIEGKSSQGSYSESLINPSLSTIGYISSPLVTTTNNYQVKYLDDNGNLQNVNPNTNYTSYSYANQPNDGYYVTKSGDAYKYYKKDTYTAIGDGQNGNTYNDYATMAVTFHASDEMMSLWTSYKSPSLTLELYIDNGSSSAIDIYDVGANTTSGTGYHILWAGTNPTINVKIPLSATKCALLLHKHATKSGSKSWDQYNADIFGGKENSKIQMKTLTGLEMKKNGSSWSITYPSLDVHMSDYEMLDTSAPWTSRPTLNAESASKTTSKDQKFYNTDCTNNELYYYKNGEAVCLENSDSLNISNADFYFDNGTFMVRLTAATFEDSAESRNFVGDAPEMTTDIEDLSMRYRSDCIDIVGGGIGFYRAKLGNWQRDICRVLSESTGDVSKTVVKDPSSYIGQKFYSTKYCQQSMVLYVRNAGSALDGVDENFGKMSFTYYQLSSTYRAIFGNTCHPAYKKGTGTSAGVSNFVSFSTLFGDPKDDSSDSTLTGYENVTITESQVQKASYCCLDAFGNILGSYKSDGTTTMSEADKAKIATYVLAIGSYTNSDVANWSLWIKNCYYSYTSNSGDGGQYYSVGYRSASDKIETTELTFSIKSAKTNFIFYIDIWYKKDENAYYIYGGSKADLAIIIYSYEDTNKIVVNNEEQTVTKYQAVCSFAANSSLQIGSPAWSS